MQMADRIAEDGFKKAGYEYVCIDVSEKPDPFAITYSLWNLFETLMNLQGFGVPITW